jgi:hypothetical protein
MGNTQKPTTRTWHMDIKSFSICEWVDRDLMYLDRIDMTINMADHFTKGLTCALFHCHANFLLGHIPPMYSPVYQLIVGMYTNEFVDIECHLPESFTTPMCAPAARVHAPLPEDYAGNPLLIILLWHGQYNLYVYNIIVCGGVLS